MDPKQIDVECPSCNSRLAIDVLTARVVRWAAAEETDASGTPKLTEKDWDAAVGRMSTRKERSGDAFEAAFSKERAREGALDDLFDQANQRVAGQGDERGGAGDRTGPTQALPGPEIQARWRVEEAAGRADRRVLGPLATDPTARGDEIELALLPGSQALATDLIEAGFRPTEVLAVWWAPVEPGAGEGDPALELSTDASAEVASHEGLPPTGPAPSGPAGSSIPERAQRARAAAASLGARRVALRGLDIGAAEDELAACGYSISHHVQRWRRA